MAQLNFMQSEAFLNSVAKPLDVLATVKDIVGPKGQLIPYVDNLANPDKQVMLTVKRADNVVVNLYCSRPVGNLLREKKLALRQLADFPVIEHTTTGNQTKVMMIVKPTALQGSAISFEDMTKADVPAYVPASNYKIEDLIAY